MGRLRIFFVTTMAISALVGTLLRAQVSDEEKCKGEIRKARIASEDTTPTPSPKRKKTTPKPAKSPSPTKKSTAAKSKKHKPADDEETTPKPKAKPGETPKAKSSATDRSDEEATPKPKGKKSLAKKSPTPGKKKKGTPKKKHKEEEPEPTKTPRVSRSPSPKPSETPVARPTSPLPRAIAVPTPSAPLAPASSFTSTAPVDESAAQLTIEKSGYEKRQGFWSRVFGGGGRSTSSSGAGYRYLTRSVRAEIDRAPANRRNPPWQFIVVHNSGTRQGNARAFDYYHRRVRHMKNGLAYHFVIGNGTSTGNGQIEIGDRWRRQINGGHVHSDYMNNIALGICLVGDFNRDQPTRAQLESCEELIRYLRQHCGKVGNHYAVVKPHREVNPPRWATDCPGDAFPYSWFRRFQE